nr:unnamed protein product [Callosobruchus chinensis]CAH7758162.1 unnamed protein product [Callosobruchus chinensis]CAH7759504.1 unnamed protein product [Callosobruchus chinensis]
MASVTNSTLKQYNSALKLWWEYCIDNNLEIFSVTQKTEQLRNSQTNNLLITFKKPYKNASSQSISRWVKCMLKLCGIDTDIFTAHSTRHAATSAAALKGISIDTIRCSAGWSEKSQVFGRFYNRPIIINNFAESILGNR